MDSRNARGGSESESHRVEEPSENIRIAPGCERDACGLETGRKGSEKKPHRRMSRISLSKVSRVIGISVTATRFRGLGEPKKTDAIGEREEKETEERKRYESPSFP